MTQLAFYTFGILREPPGHARSQGYFALSPDVFGSAAGTAGFVARNTEPYAEPSHRRVPRFFDPQRHAFPLQTLTTWADLEAVYAFAYRGQHGAALRRRREWFVDGEWPTVVAWWVGAGHLPSWEEAVACLEHLHDHGPSPFAFTLRRAFDASGRPAQLERQRVSEKLPTVR